MEYLRTVVGQDELDKAESLIDQFVVAESPEGENTAKAALMTAAEAVAKKTFIC